MKTENVELMQMAKESLRGKWGLAIGTFVVYILIVGVLQAIPVVGAIASLIISGPMALGITIFSMSLSRNEEARLEQIFDGFKHFSVALVAYLLMILYILLWLLLLIVPGIIAGLSYSLTFFIIAEDRTISAQDALRKSKAMMEGYKLKLFYLGLRMFLLALLCILTLGIGFLWLMPYANVTMVKFYEDVKNNPESVTI